MLSGGMEALKGGIVDGSVEHLREKRGAPAVLKTRLAGIRSHRAEVLVFAIEGPEDKTIYYHWLKQVAPMLAYEMIVCNGKGKLLEFRALLQRDKAGLKERVYFLADHDFDGLRGEPTGQDIYITDTYSVENHLVNSAVLDDLLKVELQCDGEPAFRARVVQRFESFYEKFLQVTREHNLRIFTAKKVGIANLKPFPRKIKPLAKVTLDDVVASDEALAEVIRLDREPTEEEVARVIYEFDALHPPLQYRGKFALAFFGRFTDLVAEDRRSAAPVIFVGLAPQVANGQLSLDAIASKSVAPLTFRNFVTDVLSTLTAPPLKVVA